MSVRADDLIDRRRLRRKVTFWRVATLLVALAAIVFASVWGYENSYGKRSVAHIAKIAISGTIVEDEELLARIDAVREASAVRGVILSIDSPGGTTAGGEAIFNAVRRLAAEKPVTAQVGTLAASAGYMIASATDHIVARQSSIVGSIGVLIQFPDFTGLMDKVGIKMEEVKSSPLKAEPSPFNPTTEEERAMVRALILDSYDWFVGIVEDRRALTRQETLALADGSIFTGRQALAKKLVDAVGGEDEAVAWLGTKGVEPGLEVVEWEPVGQGGSLLLGSSAARAVADYLGVPAAGPDLLREIGADRLFLDGLLSLWQPKGAARVD